MASFRDSAGREWVVTINPWLMKQVRDRTGVHLGKLLDDQFAGYAALMGDVVQLVDVLFVLCAEQAAREGVTDEQFGRALAGDAVEAAAAAFEEAFADFCPSHLRRILRAMRAKGVEAQATATPRVMEVISKLDLGATFSPSATTSGASSASTPPG